MCFRKAKWQREVVNDHKFDFVCIDDFKNNDAITRIRHFWLYLVVIKTILVYVADLWTAGYLLIFDRWSTTIHPDIPIDKSKWIYVGCISMSFVLLILDWRKARAIIASKDISYAFTSIIASRYYTLRSYAHHCFFCEINRQKRKVDRIAFFVFFTFKGMKKLIFAEAPRQIVNAVTLYKLVQTNITKWMNFGAYGNDPVERLAMASMAFTLLVFVISASKLAFAFILYIPLLFHIRGNLKEYCCHKIDKRIEVLLKKQSSKRRLKLKMIERAMAKGDINRLKKKDILLTLNQSRRKQPTLPILSDDDDSYSQQSLEFIPPGIPIYNQPPESITHYNNRLPPPPPSPSHLNIPHDIISHRPPSPHGYTYNSGPQTNSPGPSRVRLPYGAPNNVTNPVRYAPSQNESLFNPNNHNNPNYYNQYQYNQGYGRQ